MNADIREYAGIGLVYHMLYPDCIKDADYHVQTLLKFADRQDIDTFDCYLPYGDERRKKLADKLSTCNKNIVYALHAFPTRKISLSSLLPNEQGLMRLAIMDQIRAAADIGARGFIFVSGADVPENRLEAKKCFEEFCMWFCEELKPYNICAMLEPFDRTVDKRFLYGPIQECVELVKRVGKFYDNIGIELDFAHLPLMEERFEDAVKACAPYLKRVHLGNCVLKDPAHPLFGDQHPPIGLAGGEIDTEELVEILKLLLDCGYLGKTEKGPLVQEMTPFPGKSVEYTVEDSFNRLKKAWEKV